MPDDAANSVLLGFFTRTRDLEAHMNALRDEANRLRREIYESGGSRTLVQHGHNLGSRRHDRNTLREWIAESLREIELLKARIVPAWDDPRVLR